MSDLKYSNLVKAIEDAFYSNNISKDIIIYTGWLGYITYDLLMRGIGGTFPSTWTVTDFKRIKGYYFSINRKEGINKILVKSNMLFFYGRNCL